MCPLHRRPGNIMVVGVYLNVSKIKNCWPRGRYPHFFGLRRLNSEVTMRRLWIIAAMAAGCLAQDGPTFEVASIKPADIAPGGGYTVWSKGGPGTEDPTRIDYRNVSLSDLIR